MKKTSNKTIIPAKHYVGMVKRQDSNLPLGFITPWGEDAASKKRMSTVDSWARSNKSQSTTIENVPMHGFKITSDIRTGGRYGGGDKWRVEDPRGFELEISSNNLAELMSLGTIEKGEFLDQCVWARDVGVNVLVSVESEVYKDAIAMTKIATTSASWKDVKLGYNVILQNGIKGKYLGKYHFLINAGFYHAEASLTNSIRNHNKTLSVIHVQTSNVKFKKDIKTELHFISTPKLSQFEVKDELSIIDAEIEVNRLIQDETCYIEKTGYSDPIIASMTPINNKKFITSVDTDFDITSVAFQNTGRKNYGIFRLNSKNGNKLVSITSDYYNKKELLLTFVIEDKLSEGIYALQTELDTNYNSNHHFRNYNAGPVWKYVSTILDQSMFQSTVENKVNVILEIQTKAGNTITTIVS
jgi:hypothetical protein